MQALTLACKCKRTQMRTHTCAHAHLHAHNHARTHEHAQARTHTRRHARTRARMDRRTYARTQPLTLAPIAAPEQSLLALICVAVAAAILVSCTHTRMHVYMHACLCACTPTCSMLLTQNTSLVWGFGAAAITVLLWYLAHTHALLRRCSALALLPMPSPTCALTCLLHRIPKVVLLCCMDGINEKRRAVRKSSCAVATTRCRETNSRSTCAYTQMPACARTCIHTAHSSHACVQCRCLEGAIIQL